MKATVIACMVIALSLLGCDNHSSSLPEGVVGVVHVDDGTDYVFRSVTTRIAGACKGWSTVSIQRPGHDSTGITDLMCWKEIDGMLHTANEHGEQPKTYPMSSITSAR
ncbi:hypothetical protein WJ60_21165 [Burkholderia ubonensis]|uniref:Lipoprotein n=1 Tax=Burkholderia ubonensis TaxID=101571 RepID=A0ABD6PUZ6_9BURK|nr:hypothetical protein WJ60_21165 [Burkholderia ubonensis]OJA38349.1 hypothetical protein BGV66_30880 [Burkholderia ubonensis]